MSKLTIVREALGLNLNISVVSILKNNYLPERHGYFSHTVDYLVAPKNGLYEADELQTFMMGLIPSLEPSMKEDFEQSSDILRFGRLFFDEVIGRERRTIKRILTLTDEELYNVAGFVDGKRTIDTHVVEEYRRRILVRPFPDELYARNVANDLQQPVCQQGTDELFITLKDLETHRQNSLRSLER